MNRRIYFRAFLKRGDWKEPRYEWFQDFTDADRVDEYFTRIQTEHMTNRLVGAWRWIIPFEVKWKLGEMYQSDYNI